MPNKPKGNRVRIFNILLYPDNEQMNSAISLLNSSYNAVGIKHDKDVYTDDTDEHTAGELKKEHFHFVLKFSNPRTVEGVAKELGIDARFVQTCKNFKSSALYLLHYGDESKYQYSPDQLVGSLASDVRQLVNNKSEDVKVSEILEFVNSYNGYLPYSALLSFCCDRGYWAVLRRAGYLFSQLLYEHNAKYRLSAETSSAFRGAGGGAGSPSFEGVSGTRCKS